MSQEFYDQYVDPNVTFADIFELVDFLQGKIERTPGSKGAKPIQFALNKFEELLAAYENGDVTLQDLKDFDPGVLGNMPQWVEFFNSFIAGEEGVVLGYPDSTGEGGDEGVILPPLLPPLPNDDENNDGDDNAAGGGGGSGGEEGGEAGTSDDGGGDDGGSDSGGDTGGEGGGGEGSQQFYEVDEDGNVYVVDYEDEDGFFDENGFWQGDFKRIGNLNDDVDAWWKEIFQPGGTYDEQGGIITSPEDDPDSDDDDDDDDGLAADPDLFGGSVPTDPGPPITGGPNPPSVNDGDGEGTFDTDPNTGDPQTGGPQPPGGDGGGGDGTTDDGTNTGGGGDDTGGGGGAAPSQPQGSVTQGGA